jgi:hypothetical protein
MDLFSYYWPDFIAAVLGLGIVNGALTGKFYTHGKGRKKLIVDIKSIPARIGFLCIAALIFVWLVRDLRMKLH